MPASFLREPLEQTAAADRNTRPSYSPDRRIQEYTDLAMRGEASQARAVRDSLNPVRRALKETCPPGKMRAHFKHWLELLGHVGGPVRRLLLNLTDEEKARIRTAFEASGLGKQASPAGG